MNNEDGPPSETNGTGVPTLTRPTQPAPASELETSLIAAREQLVALNKIIEEAKVAGAVSAENQRQSAAALAEAKSKLAETSAVAAAALAASTKIESDQAVIATKSDHINAAQAHADTVRAELDKIVTSVTQKATAAEGFQVRVQAAADEANSILTSVQTTKAAADAGAVAINETLGESRVSAAQAKKLADKSDAVDESIAMYEKRLKELDAESTSKLETILGLLPGATSAGLASAFAERALSFNVPRIRWQRVFIGSLVLLIALGATGLIHVIWTGDALTYDELIRLWLSRLPVAGALLWITLHAARESALARRLEEDYGYKSAIASSFEGFNNQMREIGAASQDNEPLKLLCENTLKIISNPPGRIYDGHKLAVTPSSEMAALVAAILAAEKAAKSVKNDDG
jgi:hypothetical protein